MGRWGPDLSAIRPSSPCNYDSEPTNHRRHTTKLSWQLSRWPPLHHRRLWQRLRQQPWLHLSQAQQLRHQRQHGHGQAPRRRSYSFRRRRRTWGHPYRGPSAGPPRRRPRLLRQHRRTTSRTGAVFATRTPSCAAATATAIRTAPPASAMAIRRPTRRCGGTAPRPCGGARDARYVTCTVVYRRLCTGEGVTVQRSMHESVY